MKQPAKEQRPIFYLFFDEMMEYKERVSTRATRFFGGFTSHLFLESLGYVCVALKRIWLRVVIFRSDLSIL